MASGIPECCSSTFCFFERFELSEAVERLEQLEPPFGVKSFKDLTRFGRSQKENYDASNPVESSGIVGKNFPFDLRIEALHRFEPGNRVEFA
jgi:hypothetical protein